MKYGLLSFEKFITGGYIADNSKRNTINAGDALEMFALRQIYDKIGVPEDQIVEIGLHELKKYRGEYVILPVNWLSFNSAGNDILFEMSPYIVPVYLGISITALNLTETQIFNLRKYEPIGCRDERTMWYLRSKGVSAYLNGCVGMLYSTNIEKKHSNPKDIYFVDVPKSILEYVPDEIKPRIRFFSQEIYATREEIPNNDTPSDWVRSVINEYKENASLIVTSRFHGAVIGLALDIPVIITLENYTFRFSWLSKYLPFYTPKTFSQIDWNPVLPDVSEIKERMLAIAIARIKETYQKYAPLLTLSALMENSAITDHLNSTNQTLYYEPAINYISKVWPHDEPIEYAFWGVNDNAEAIYKYISENFTNAKLTAVYDMYKVLEFKGIRSVAPQTIKNDSNTFIFVTSYIASMFADTFFADRGVSSNKFFLCTRDFLREEDLQESKWGKGCDESKRSFH